MEKSKLLKALADLSVIVGNEVAYVQGGGGNTSVKLSSTEMAIKASGSNLKNMTVDNGYSIVDYRRLNSFLDSDIIEEDSFSEKIISFRTSTNNRPSIETGFHSFLGKYVIHTHSAYVNALTCASEGQEILASLFPESVWIDYATPGRDLTLEIKKNISFPIEAKGTIFLKNHGLIVWDETYQGVLTEHQKISETIIKKFDLPALSFNKDEPYLLNAEQSQLLFPDQAVFTLAGEEILASRSAQEAICAHNYILLSISLMGLTPIFLPAQEAEKLLNMESEKYRQELIKR